MSLKINFLIISIVIFTIVSVVDNSKYALQIEESTTSGNHTTKLITDQHENDSDYLENHAMFELMSETKDTISRDSITCENLVKFKEAYDKEILQYCKKNQINNNEEDQVMSANLSYFKDIFNDYYRYNPAIILGSNVFIHFLLMRKIDQYNELKEEIANFKKLKEEDLRKSYQCITSFPLPENIESEYFLEQFRFTYNMSNAIASVFNKPKVTIKELVINIGNNKNTSKDTKHHCFKCTDIKFTSKTYEEFVLLYIKELNMYDSKSFPNQEISSKDINFEAEGKTSDDEISKVAVVKNFIHDQYVSRKWKYYKFDIEVFFQYLILDKSMIHDINADDKVTFVENGESQSMDVYTAFLKYFKESLDSYYNLNIFVDINKIEDENKTLFYKHMLRNMANIYNAYNVTTTRLSIPKFVKLMIDLAVTILESNKTKKGENQPKSDEKNKESTDIVVREIWYHYAKSDCALPNKVYLKDVLNHLIAKYIRENNSIAT